MPNSNPTNQEDSSDPLDLALGRAFRRPGGRRSSAESTSGRGASDPRPGRFEFQEEIGRGGMGVVRRALDRSFAREVAIKELRPEALGEPKLVSRFREEARISAHLQHPGVVPVYDGGEVEASRPYFAMKLVEGETLRDRLKRCADNRAARGELLPLFLRVCEAVGYAHARGVVHRDLKPANVMLGEHGEVFVMDWGLAKVLGPLSPEDARTETMALFEGEAHTISGHAVGTPGYMPPEQCAGGSGRYAAWSDVWALGAILFEILVGEPLANRKDEGGRSVVRAWDSTVAALASVGLEPELTELALSCLEPDPLKRPFDAMVLAKRLRAWSNQAEARARAAEIEAAETRLRIAHERRVRRLTLLVLGVVILALLAGGLTWWSVAESRRERRDSANDSVRRALDDLGLARERASMATTDQELAWRNALSVANSAASIAKTTEASAEMRARAEAALGEVEGRLREVVAREARLSADRAAVARLDAIAEPASDGRAFDLNDREYEALFRAQGLDLESMTDDAILVAVRASGIQRRLVEGLVDWSGLRHRLEEESGRRFPVQSRRIFRLAQKLSDHPAERAVLQAMEDSQFDRPLADLSDDDWRNVAPAILRVYGDTFGTLHGADRAIAVFRRAARLHPGDFYLNFQLGWWSRDKGGESDIESRSAFSAALALRPSNALVRVNIATQLRRAGNDDGARLLLEEAVRVDPKCAGAYYNLGVIHTFRKEIETAITYYSKTLEHDPDHAFARSNLGVSYLRVERREEGLRLIESAVAREDRIAPALGQLGNEWFRDQHFEAARDVLERAVALSPNDPALLRILVGVLAGSESNHEAVRLSERRLELLRAGPTPPPARDEAAVALLRARAEAGERAAENALAGSSTPKSAEDWVRAALVMRSLARRGDELGLWEKAVESASPDIDEHLGHGALAILASSDWASLPTAKRDQALDWFQRALRAIRAGSTEDQGPWLNRRGRVARWLRDPALEPWIQAEPPAEWAPILKEMREIASFRRE